MRAGSAIRAKPDFRIRPVMRTRLARKTWLTARSRFRAGSKPAARTKPAAGITLTKKGRLVVRFDRGMAKMEGLFFTIGRYLWLSSCITLTATAILMNYLITTDAPLHAYWNSGISWDYGPWLLPQALSGIWVIPGLLLWLPICWSRRVGPWYIVPLLLLSHVVTLLAIPVALYEGWRVWRWAGNSA